VADWETVRKLALSLPEVDASSSGRVAFSVRGKGFAWEARERDGGGLAVRVERDEKDLILQSNPTSTSRARTTRDSRQSRSTSTRSVVTSCGTVSRTPGIQAPKKLAAAYVAENASG